MHLDYLSWEAFAALFTGLIAVGGAVWLGRTQAAILKRQNELIERQERLSDLSIKGQLFERRLLIYEATQTMILEIIRDADFPGKSFSALQRLSTNQSFSFLTTLWNAFRSLRTMW